MVYFRDDDEEYVSWVERHPAGYVLNLGTGGKRNAMLHTARCTKHMYPVNTALSNTHDYPKACSRYRDELERWGREAGYVVAACADCRP